MKVSNHSYHDLFGLNDSVMGNEQKNIHYLPVILIVQELSLVLVGP